MNRFAYRTTGLAIKTLSNLSKARIHLHGQDNIPGGPIVFVINHFTRLETILMPYLINRATGQTVWSLGDAELFQGTLDAFLDAMGVVSTRDPDRDRLIVKTLLTGEAAHGCGHPGAAGGILPRTAAPPVDIGSVRNRAHPESVSAGRA
jgi:hypothetical protein